MKYYTLLQDDGLYLCCDEYGATWACEDAHDATRWAEEDAREWIDNTEGLTMVKVVVYCWAAGGD